MQSASDHHTITFDSFVGKSHNCKPLLSTLVIINHTGTYFTNFFLNTLSKIKCPELVMGLSPGPAWARPGPIHFSWDFYVVKNTGSSRLGIELL